MSRKWKSIGDDSVRPDHEEDKPERLKYAAEFAMEAADRLIKPLRRLRPLEPKKPE